MMISLIVLLGSVIAFFVEAWIIREGSLSDREKQDIGLTKAHEYETNRNLLKFVSFIPVFNMFVLVFLLIMFAIELISKTGFLSKVKKYLWND